MKNGTRTILLPLGDVLMLLLAFFLMLEIAFFGNLTSDIAHQHFSAFLYVFFIWLFVFFIFNLYEAQSIKPTIQNLKMIGVASVVSLTASTILFYIVPILGITPKTNLVIFSFIFVLLFIVWRRFFYGVFSMYFQKNIVIIGNIEKDNTYIQKMIDYIKNYPQSGFFIPAIYSSFDEFFQKQKDFEVDTLVISKNILTETKNLSEIYLKVKNILDLTDAYENILSKIPVDYIGEEWFLRNVRVNNSVLSVLISKILDIVFSILVLIVTSPILLIAALCIKLEDKGSMLYTQERVGKNGKNFKIFKLRSMIMGADKNGAEWTEVNDPRITRLGKIIRKLHIDEIPQLWNILKGEMTLVGPRPEIPSFEEKLQREIPHYGLRHIITPGFTGWAQIKWRNARGITESKEKFEYDLYYIKNRNFFMDLGIIVRTIQIIFTH